MARLKAPSPTGQISGGGLQTGGTYQPAGAFAAKARRRIKETVLAWLQKHGAFKLARGKKPTKPAKPFYNRKAGGKTTGDLPVSGLGLEKPAHEVTDESEIRSLPAHDTAIHKAKQRSADEAARAGAGGDPHIVAPPVTPAKLRSRLTIRELKDVEKQLQLPAALHLSSRPENRDRTDNEPVASQSLDSYYKWANDVARHIQRNGLTQTTIDRLRDPKHLSKAKLAFITSRMSREVDQAKQAFADSGGAAKWYGDDVAVMTRHLHDEFHNGTPADDEMWGKLQPNGHVHGGAAATIAKLFVAASSGGQKPHENYDTAHAMIEAGYRHGGGSINPFKSIPDNQADDHAAWIDAVTQWHKQNKTGVTKADIVHPGLDLKKRAEWYERVVAPLPKTLSDGYSGTNGAARYSGINARFVADKASEHYGAPIWVDKGGKRSPYTTSDKYKPIQRSDKAALKSPAGVKDYSAWLEAQHPDAGQTRSAKLPAVDAEGKLQPPGWTKQAAQVLDGRDKINGVISYFTHHAGGDEREGLKAAAQFFLTEQSAERFNDIIKWTQAHDPHLAGRFEKAVKENRGFYFEGQPLPGAFLLGPKFGAFALNLHLDQPNSEHHGAHLTGDMWWARDWNVMLGTLFGPDNSSKSRQETPRGGGSGANPERKLMRKAAQLAAERAGLDNIAQLQAVQWYYEQLKPQWFGVDTSSTSYYHGANVVAARKGKKYHLNKVTGHIELKDRDPNDKTFV